MSLDQLRGYFIRDRNGDRIPANECILQPLNFLLPGNAPLLVPKRTKKKPKKRGQDGYTEPGASVENDEHGYASDSDEEDKEDKEDDDEYVQPIHGKTAAKKTQKQAATEPTPQRKKADKQHSKRSEQENKYHKDALRTQQEEDIVKLVGKYMRREGKAQNKRKNKKKSSLPNSSTNDHDSDSEAFDADAHSFANDKHKNVATAKKHKLAKRSASSDEDGSATDTSSRVRDILASMRIYAAGSDGDDAFTPSEEFQLLVLKKNGETWNDISKTMNRPKNQLKNYYKHLKYTNAKVPGEDAGAISDTGAIIDGNSSDEQSDDQKTAKGKKKSSVASRKKLRKKQKLPKNSSKALEEQVKPNATAIFSAAESAAANSPMTSETVYDTDIKSYIAQYTEQILGDHCAGRVTIPDADNKFDEDDCMLLALAKSRHATDRWLHIQAEFANFTGRLVPEEVLKWKLGEGEKPDGY